MKKIIITLLVMFVGIGLLACNDVGNEIKNTVNHNEISLENEGTEDNKSYEIIRTYMLEECKKAFSPYYEILDFEISDYKEEILNGNVEATFLYKLIVKNYDKDPDTVGYIKEAKENGSKYYQQMYNEYLQPRDMNFQLRVVIDENDLITLYSNISPKEIEWEETKMTDYILK